MGAIDAATTAFKVLLIISLSSSSNTRADTQQHPKQIIPLGSSLYPTTKPTSWPSPSGLFAFGFYRQGSDFAVGIWLVGLGSGNNNTVVWTANRDDPPLASASKLQLTKEGKLVVQTEQGLEKLIAHVNATASSASMLDSGNFVLLNNNSSVFIWQSFDYPTDTILGDQSLLTDAQLFSSSSEISHSTGRFNLKMQGDGDLVLYPTNISEGSREAYWATGTWQGLYHLYLNKTTGSLLIRNNSNLSPIQYLNEGSSVASKDTIYRATLDVEGLFTLYVHHSSGIKAIQNWPDNECSVKGFCGFNSYCTLNDQKPYCNCLPGFDFIDPKQETLGCKRNSTEPKCGGVKDDSAFYSMVPMEGLGMGDLAYFQAQLSPEEACSSSCLEDCYCWAAFYQNELCKKHGLPLRFAKRIDQGSSPSTTFVKVGSVKPAEGNYVPWPVVDPSRSTKSTSNKAIVHIILVTSIFTLIFCLTIGISSHLIYKIRVLRYKRLLEIGDLGLNEEVTLRKFSYGELKRATNGFKQELGKGSFGAVYKGALNKGRRRRLIAVKRLEKLVEEGEREFQAEMRAIGKTHHKNLVRLLGFCADGSKRLLVYEYMSNGSLGNLIFGDAATLPDWDERVRIALDIARGILYLHEECEAPIIHCDIKPQNILMDEFWTAKISDFGLAKLLMPDQTRTFTGVRGTRGYLAPEWSKNAPITVKADIYSYGIVLLETLCCRKNIEVNVSEPEEILLSGWAYKCFVSREINKLVHCEEVDKNALENMVKVALWCIQDEHCLRPSMKSVVLMLEGITEVAIPPCPTSGSM